MKYVITFFAVVLIFSANAQKTDLKLTLKVGSTYTQTTNSKVTIVQDLNGQKLNMVMSINGTMTYEVKDIVEDDYKMEVLYKNLLMEMQMPQGTMRFSSEIDNKQDIMSTMLASMKNKPFTVVMAKNGKIKKVENVESIFESSFDGFPNLSEEQKTQIKGQLLKAYGEEAFKGNIEMVTAIFPDNPVSKGDSWNISTKLESGFAAEIESTYTYSDETADYRFITGKSTIKTADKDAYIESNGMPMKYDLSGTMQSEIKIDKSSGWIKEAIINQKFSGSAFIKENPQMPQGMVIPMEIESELSVTE